MKTLGVQRSYLHCVRWPLWPRLQLCGEVFTMPTRALDSKPSRAYQVEVESKGDKCVISKLLKGVPLATADTGPEPELGLGTSLPPPKEIIKGNIKTVTKSKLNEDGKKFRMVHTFRIKTQKASKAIARRKN